MNEQALRDLYNLALNNGYGDSIEDFKNLLGTNEDALNDMYNLSVKNGYGDSIDEFKSLMGVTQQPVVQPTVKKKDDMEWDWFGGDGSSELEPSKTERPTTVAEASQTWKKAEAPKPMFMPDYTKPIEEEKFTLTRPTELGFVGRATPEQLKEQTPRFIEENLESLTPKQLASYGAKGTKELLDYYFKDAGFKIDADREYVNVVSPDGQTYQVNTLLPSKTQLDELKNFVRLSAYNNPQIADKAYLYEKENKKFKTKEEIDNEVKNVNAQEEQFMGDYKKFLNLKKDIDDIEADLKRWRDFGEQNTAKYIQTEAYLNERKKELEQYSGAIKEKAIDLKAQGEQLNKAVGKYTEFQATQGDFGGTLYRAVAETSAGIFSQYLRLATSKTIDMLPISALMSEENYQSEINKKLKERGYKDEKTVPIDVLNSIKSEIKDDFKKAAITGEYQGEKLNNVLTINGVRESLSEFLTTPITSTSEYKQKREKEGGFIERGMIGLAGSLPAMVGGKYLRYMNMFMMTTDAAMKEMDNNPNFANISENEKELVALPIGVVGAALEEIGLKNLKLGKSVTSGIIKTVIGRVPANATASTVRKATFDVVAEMGIKAGTAYAGGILSEMETGAAQQMNEYLIKDIYSTMKGKKMFDNPAFLSGQYLYDVWDASRTEGVGAGVMSVPYSIAAAFQKDGFQALDDATFKIFEDLAKDNDSRKFFVTSLKNKINLGEVTPNQGKQMLDAYDQALGMIGMVPDEITDPESRKIAMDLLSERKRLETKKQGKDDALAKPIQNKIDQINEQLTKLTEDAIQKQAASQVSVQPETGAGQEVEVGGTEAKPKITPEESKRKEDLIAAFEDPKETEVLEDGKPFVYIKVGEYYTNKEMAQAELEAITQKEQAAVTEQGGMEQAEGLGTQLETVAKEEQAATEKTTTSIITSAPIEIKGGVVVTDSDGNDVVVNGNEQVVAKLYDEAMAVPEDQRTSNQNDIVEKVQRIISQAAAETTTAEVTPVEQFTEQDRARKAELEEAMRKADKRRKNITIGETTMPKAEAKAELDALVQKEQAVQQPAAVEVAPAEVTAEEVVERTPEQEADLLEELLTGKKKEPVVTETITEVKEESPALANVEATAKALEELDKKKYKQIESGSEDVNQRGVKFSDIFIGDTLLEDLIATLSEDVKRQVKEIFSRGIDYFKFNEAEQKSWENKFVNPEDFNEVFDMLATSGLARESAYQFYNDTNYEYVKDEINYILKNKNEYSKEFIEVVEKINQKLKNPQNSMQRLYAIDIAESLGFSKSPRQISEAYHKAKADGSNPELVQAVEEVLGKPEVKAEPTSKEAIAKRLRGKKNKGLMSSIDFGISQALYNGALEFMATQVEKGTKLGNAIANTIKWIDEKMQGKSWDKDGFTKYANTTFEEVTTKKKAKDILDVYPKGSVVGIADLASESGDTIISNVLSKMKDVFNKVKISGRRPTEGAAFYNYNTKEIDVNKNSPHWDEVEGDQIASALSHEFAHHLIDGHSEREAIETDLQEIKDDLIANKPELTESQKKAYEFMTSKNNSPQEILTYAVSDPDIRPILTKYKDKLNNISNKLFGEDVISGIFEEQKTKKDEIQPQRTRDRRGRTESRAIAPLEGAPSVPGFSGPDPQLTAVAEEYAKENGIPYKRQGEYVKVDEDRAKRIAQAYEEMKHDPQNPKVKEAYENLIKQTIAQYEALVKAGYKFWFIDTNIPSNLEYAQSPFNAMRDVRSNKQMGVFPTTDGFGSSDIDVSDNPMMAETKFKWPVGGMDGELKPVLANDLFRAVHDAFGHGLEGAGFRARGEENAWQAHIRLFTGSAVGAITSETRGQNSWLNFGPHGEKNRSANTDETIFADQKTGLMPEWTWKEGVAADMETTAEEIVPKGKKLSDTIRGLEIKGPGGLQSNLFGIPIAIWNAAVKTTAAAIDANIAVAEALQRGAAKIKNWIKKNDPFNKLTDEKINNKVLRETFAGAVKIARDNNVSEEGIKTYLKRKGLTDEQIEVVVKKRESKPATTQAEVKEKTTAKKVDVSDIKELEQIVKLQEDAINAGKTSVTEAVKEFIRLFNKSKIITKLTRSDLNKIINLMGKVSDYKSLQTATGKMFDIILKSNPDLIEVSKTKLAEEFKKKVNAGIRQGKKDLNTKRKELTAAIKEMKKKGSISVRQAKALINRVNAVNLDNPVMVKRLLTYAENVFNDADYDTRIQEVRKLQEKVKKVNHVSMRDTVREFASINPERIPADRLLDYIQALDDMSTRTPFYQKMNDMFDEVMSYKSESKEFDAIKTFQALIDKLESIAINQVKSVEDYVALIRDINSFKRKAYQLLQNGAITQEQYDKAIENVGKDQAAVEKKYEKELAALKEKLVQEINGLKPEVHPDFTPEEAALINKYLELSDDDLASLSPEDLYILNDLLNNIKEDAQLDYYRLSEIVSKAYTNAGGQKLAEQLNESKFNKSSDEGKKLLLEQESAFWEGLLGLGRAVSGALQKFIVSPFNRAIASYENAMKDGYYEFSKLKKKYKMKDYNMHRLGIFTTYLQEYMAQFDPANKDVKDIGTRDWFGEIISNSSMRDGYRSAKPSALRLIGMGDTELKIIEKIYKSLPKDANGKVDPKAVYDSFMANDGKFFTKKEKAFFDKIMDWKQKNLTTKQKAANEMNGMPFKEIPFHMMRVRLDRGAKQISPTAEGGSGVVRIEAGTGKERASQKVGPIMTNFEQLFTENLEQTARNYYLQEAINDINNTLSVAKKNLKEEKEGLFNTIPETISDRLNFEFDKTESQFLARNLLAARAAETLLSPIRTAVELTSTFLSYPFRAKTPQGYKELFGKQGQMKKLLEFTSSPLRLRENINKAIDISDGRIKPKGRFEKALNYLSGLPERTMMVTSWMPTFNNEFKDITGVRFDMDKFKSDAEYRQKYGKAIKEAAAVADAQTEKIIGSTTKAGGRREIRIAPKILANIFGAEGTIKKNTTAGQILGFFSNYPYREVTEFLNGFREAAEVYKQGGGVIKSISQLQKPLGVTINLATYGFLSSVVYAMKLMLLGDDEDEEKGEAALKELVTLKGFMEELQGNAISLAASKYAAGGKAMLQLGATVAYNSTSDEEWKAKIKKLLKNSVFVEPIAAEKVQAYGGRNEVLGAISSYVPQFVLFAKRIEETIQTAGELKVMYKKFQDGGIDALSEDEGLAILAIDGLFKSAQAVLNLRGTSLPMYNDIKMYMKGIKKEAGVGDIKLSGTENQHKKALQGYKNEKEFKENDPDGYLEAIDEGGSIYKYKEEQRKKQEEENKDKPFRGMSEEAFKKKYRDEYIEKYGPGTDYYEEQRTDEAIERRAEQRRVKREEKRIKAKNKENEEDTEE